MEHSHKVYDTDAHFTINPVTRMIKNESSKKVSLIQKDHNSKRFTFEIPRYIEEHDMSTCNKVEVHYLNIDTKTKEQVKGVYEVDDLQISPEDENVVICSWLVSSNSTQLNGVLHFLLRYKCVEDGIVHYSWNTAFYKLLNYICCTHTYTATTQCVVLLVVEFGKDYSDITYKKCQKTLFQHFFWHINITLCFYLSFSWPHENDLSHFYNYTIPSTFNTQYPSPSTQLVKIPYKITGPAMVKILQPIPKTCPSHSVK